MSDKEELLQMRVSESKQRDVGKRRARMGPDAMDYLHVAPGDIIEIVGNKTSCAIVWPSDENEKNPGPIINSLVSKELSNFRIPIMIVPGNFSSEHIASIT